uniref:Uncharacterized protein n=1 Tax=Neobodo designis TaxID=312471 RepID=A0A7S1L5T4_NEODS
MGSTASKLEAARQANAASLAGREALVVGATAGIGRALAIRLARGGASVIVVGRNADAGAKVVEELNAATAAHAADATPAPKHAFLRGDMSLMRNARALAASVAQTKSHLDYVVFCQTKATLQGRTPTPVEGIDEKLALNFYSRVFLARELAPLLAKSPSKDARVMSVLSAGVHAPYAAYAEDPYLERNYGQKAAADTAGFYNDLWVDWAAADAKTGGGSPVTFVHAAPGFVATNWGTDMPLAVRGTIRCLQAVGGRDAMDCAELIGQGLLSPALKGGARYIGEYGQEVPVTKLHDAAAVASVKQATLALIDKAVSAAALPAESDADAASS